MWCEFLQRNKFLSSLYAGEVPKLLNVRMAEIKLSDDGRKFTVFFNMPRFADIPPSKWISLGYNTVFVELAFVDITEIMIKSSGGKYRGNIEIQKNEDGKFEVCISGTVEINLTADFGIVKEVTGYISETPE
ncbi:hypothetical protein CBW65_02605 [Tumebacillus avium]|uniref:Immunity protein 50 n=1 Tax=Tumebacillus avium TaxID=1903704 RepID=A0A1Y0IJ31_9BACL|nr:Imm50 family immunity protein [Tumebacillus avium]ARU60079.1 hypothetical protein CBW65_02605 [Tumebacillus avium]